MKATMSDVIRNGVSKKPIWKRDVYDDHDVYEKISAARLNVMRRSQFWGRFIMNLPVIEADADVFEEIGNCKNGDEENPFPGVAFTDGKAVYYYAPAFATMGIEAIEFVFLHEVYHVALEHVAPSKTDRRFNPEETNQVIMNIATDYVINADLLRSPIININKSAVSKKPNEEKVPYLGDDIYCINITSSINGLYDPIFEDMSSEEAYDYIIEKIKEENPDFDPSGMGGGSIGVIYHDEDDNPKPEQGSSPIKAASTNENGEMEHQEVEEPFDADGNYQGPKLKKGSYWVDKNGNIHVVADADSINNMKEKIKSDITQSAIISKQAGESAGSIPKAIQLKLDEWYTPKGNWKAVLRQFTKAIFRPRFNMKSPAKKHFNRGFVLPSRRSKTKKLDLIFAIDASGSMCGDELKKVFGEIEGILRSFRNYRLHVFCFDADAVPESYQVIEGDFKSAYDRVKKYVDNNLAGGGGTRFESVWEFIDQKKIDSKGMVFFTDGYPFSNEWEKNSHIPTVFLTIGNPTWKAPFGKTIAYEDF